MEIKRATTIEEQISLLKERGIIIDNENEAADFLSNVNYYTLSGYLHAFKTNDSFPEGMTMKKVIAIYQCDRSFRNVLLYALGEIEQNLKTKIAYCLAHEIGPVGYLDENNFIDKEKFDSFKQKFDDAVKRNKKLPFVKHHIKKYESVMPIWVSINLFTLGMIQNFYENLNTPLKKEIAKRYNISSDMLLDWMKCIVYLRNLVAHYMRLYDFKIQVTPRKDKKRAEKDENKNVPNPSSYVFDIIYMMQFLYPNRREWDLQVKTAFRAIFDQYKKHIDISSYGFPKKWGKYL